MIVVGVPVDLAGLDRLASIVNFWARGVDEKIVLHIVFNGRLTPDVPRLLRDLRTASAVPVTTTMLPVGYLPGRFPQLRAQQLIRDRTLAGGASHLLFHEVYRMPTGADGLDRLLAAEADVAGALYRDPYALGHYCAYKFSCDPRECLRYDVLPSILPEEPVSVPGVGFGFTLIRRTVLAAVPFRAGAHATDSFFSMDCRQRGYSIVACPPVIYNAKVDGDEAVAAAWWAAKGGALPGVGPDSPHRFRAEIRARLVRLARGHDGVEAIARSVGLPTHVLARWVAVAEEAAPDTPLGPDASRQSHSRQLP